MHRHELNQEQFAKIEHLLPARKAYLGANATDNHNFLNGLFGSLKTGVPSRDLPERYGKWKNVHQTEALWGISSSYCKRGKYFLCAVKFAASIIAMLI